MQTDSPAAAAAARLTAGSSGVSSGGGSGGEGDVERVAAVCRVLLRAVGRQGGLARLLLLGGPHSLSVGGAGAAHATAQQLAWSAAVAALADTPTARAALRSLCRHPHQQMQQQQQQQRQPQQPGRCSGGGTHPAAAGSPAMMVLAQRLGRLAGLVAAVLSAHRCGLVLS